ncbi:MAG: LuxR C-terminal-related transcriptional regulator [Micromonosporaceae bacterium]
MVTAGERGSIHNLFDGLVPDEVLASYERLLAEGGCPKEHADTFVGGAATARELIGRGMAHVHPHTPAEPAMFRPAPPDLALQGVLIGLQTRLLDGQEQLLNGYRRLAGAQARSYVGTDDRLPAHLVRFVADKAEIGSVSASLIAAARKDWMVLESLGTDMPLTEDFAQPPLAAFGGRVRCRAIYPTTVMDDPAGRRIVRACAEAGQQARLLPGVAAKLKLADQTAALLPLTPSGAAGALLVRAPVITAALREYFELLWDKATPIGSKRLARTAGRLSPAQRTVLALMAEGLHDDAIARRAGLSTTTVRRHIAAVMKRLDVTSRFAAGAAAQRRGWIG